MCFSKVSKCFIYTSPISISWCILCRTKSLWMMFPLSDITVTIDNCHISDTDNSIVCSTSRLGKQQWIHQIFSLQFLCKGNHVAGGFPHIGSVMPKAFPCHDVIMEQFLILISSIVISYCIFRLWKLSLHSEHLMSLGGIRFSCSCL